MEDLESEAKFAISHTRGSNTLTTELDFEPSTGDSGFKDNIAKGQHRVNMQVISRINNIYSDEDWCFVVK